MYNHFKLSARSALIASALLASMASGCGTGYQVQSDPVGGGTAATEAGITDSGAPETGSGSRSIADAGLADGDAGTQADASVLNPFVPSITICAKVNNCDAYYHSEQGTMLLIADRTRNGSTTTIDIPEAFGIKTGEKICVTYNLNYGNASGTGAAPAGYDACSTKTTVTPHTWSCWNSPKASELKADDLDYTPLDCSKNPVKVGGHDLVLEPTIESIDFEAATANVVYDCTKPKCGGDLDSQLRPLMLKAMLKENLMGALTSVFHIGGKASDMPHLKKASLVPPAAAAAPARLTKKQAE